MPTMRTTPGNSVEVTGNTNGIGVYKTARVRLTAANPTYMTPEEAEYLAQLLHHAAQEARGKK